MALFKTILLFVIISAHTCLALETLRTNEGEWSIDESTIDPDDLEYGREQFKDLTDWKNINASDWTDLSVWKMQRAAKDKTPNWRVLVRNKRDSEPVGKLIKCLGRCTYFTGEFSSQAKSLTNLKEGDEFQTSDNSTAWIVLVDGTLLRVSPNTSLTFNEVNLSKDEVFFLVRLNFGHLQYQSRLQGKFKALNESESDLAFLPLLVKKANREYFSILEYERFNKAEKIQYSIVPNAGYISQYVDLNDRTNNKDHVALKRDTKIFFYTPNISLVSKNMNGSLFYSPRGNTYLKVEETIPFFTSMDSRVQEVSYQLRGYETRSMKALETNKWLKVNIEGTELSESSKNIHHLHAARGFLRRIPTIQLAREIYLNQYFVDALDPVHDGNTLARDHGIRLWNEGKRPEMFLRETYLREYIRRTETTNLKSLAKIYPEENLDVFDVSYIEDAMFKHYTKLKRFYSPAHMAVREMNQNEYYLWLLRND